MAKKTLLQTRIEQRDQALRDAIESAKRMEIVLDGGYVDVLNRFWSLQLAVREAARWVQSVEDLQDIEKYGPGGGR